MRADRLILRRRASFASRKDNSRGNFTDRAFMASWYDSLPHIAYANPCAAILIGAGNL